MTCIFSFFLVLKALLYMSILGYSLSDMHSSLNSLFKRFYCDAREKSSAGGCRGTPQVRSSGTVARALEPFHLPACVDQCARAHMLCSVTGSRVTSSTGFGLGSLADSSLSNQSSETLVFSRKIGILILVPYVFSLVFALMSRNKAPCQEWSLNIRIGRCYNYCKPIIKITNDIIVITVQPMYLPAISQSDGSAFSTFRI